MTVELHVHDVFITVGESPRVLRNGLVTCDVSPPSLSPASARWAAIPMRLDLNDLAASEPSTDCMTPPMNWRVSRRALLRALIYYRKRPQLSGH